MISKPGAVPLVTSLLTIGACLSNTTDERQLNLYQEVNIIDKTTSFKDDNTTLDNRA